MTSSASRSAVGPVKTLVKGFSDQRPWGRMMSVDPSMDLEEELLPLVGGDGRNILKQSYVRQFKGTNYPFVRVGRSFTI